MIFFVGLYLAARPLLYTGGMVRLVPPDRRGRAKEVMGHVGSALPLWLLGKLVAMVFVGVLVW